MLEDLQQESKRVMEGAVDGLKEFQSMLPLRIILQQHYLVDQQNTISHIIRNKNWEPGVVGITYLVIINSLESIVKLDNMKKLVIK